MTAEIKEIIELINSKYKDYYIDDFLSGEDIKKLVDYTTNLREENEKLKSKIDELINKQQFIEEKFDYKSRNEKAISILKDTNVDMPGTLLIEIIDYTIHILNGGD